jgi:hypothetical protein
MVLTIIEIEKTICRCPVRLEEKVPCRNRPGSRNTGQANPESTMKRAVFEVQRRRVAGREKNRFRQDNRRQRNDNSLPDFAFFLNVFRRNFPGAHQKGPWAQEKESRYRRYQASGNPDRHELQPNQDDQGQDKGERVVLYPKIRQDRFKTEYQIDV